ncbi:MAG: hypothetical protein ABIH50_03695 [bacterium]
MSNVIKRQIVSFVEAARKYSASKTAYQKLLGKKGNKDRGAAVDGARRDLLRIGGLLAVETAVTITGATACVVGVNHFFEARSRAERLERARAALAKFPRVTQFAPKEINDLDAMKDKQKFLSQLSQYLDPALETLKRGEIYYLQEAALWIVNVKNIGQLQEHQALLQHSNVANGAAAGQLFNGRGRRDNKFKLDLGQSSTPLSDRTGLMIINLDSVRAAFGNSDLCLKVTIYHEMSHYAEYLAGLFDPVRDLPEPKGFPGIGHVLEPLLEITPCLDTLEYLDGHQGSEQDCYRSNFLYAQQNIDEVWRLRARLEPVYQAVIDQLLGVEGERIRSLGLKLYN